MPTKDEKSFEQKGNEVAVEIGKLGALSDELNSESEKCKFEPDEVGSWITAIGKAVIAIFGFRVGSEK